MIFLDKGSFQIPGTSTPPAAPYSISTSCGASADWHIVGMWPHMHSYGVHETIQIVRQGVTMKTPLDTDYDWLMQPNYTMDLLVPNNDQVALTCSWVNNTSGTVSPGEDAGAERCRAGLYMWPKQGAMKTCMNQ